MKINFTKANMLRLCELANDALFEKKTITTKLGQVLNIFELIHTTTVNQLNEIRLSLSKKIEKIEEGDEWTSPDNDKLQAMKETKELVNLIIGYKRYNAELAENKAKKAELTKKLEELKESTKTPEDRIRDIEKELKELDEF